MTLRPLFSLLMLAAFALRASAAPVERVFLITIDGLRWEEVFSGADPALVGSTAAGVRDTNALKQRFWRDDPAERRAALMPFFWGTLAKQGQLWGNQFLGSTGRVTNGRNFTYPGFNELLTGTPDDRIVSNAKRANPNLTVLEWLHAKPAFTNRMAQFLNWDTHPFIYNSARSGIFTWTGVGSSPTNPAVGPVDQIAADTTPVWKDMTLDSFHFHAASHYVALKRPRIVAIAFSEPDEWAHEGRYEQYLQSANLVDGYLARLWELCQNLEEYRGKTAFIITCDHGRGSAVTGEWKNHGAAIEPSKFIWLAAIGPGIKSLGERGAGTAFTQSQIAATLATLLGEDWSKANPAAGAAIADITGR